MEQAPSKNTKIISLCVIVVILIAVVFIIDKAVPVSKKVGVYTWTNKTSWPENAKATATGEYDIDLTFEKDTGTSPKAICIETKVDTKLIKMSVTGEGVPAHDFTPTWEQNTNVKYWELIHCFKSTSFDGARITVASLPGLLEVNAYATTTSLLNH